MLVLKTMQAKITIAKVTLKYFPSSARLHFNLDVHSSEVILVFVHLKLLIASWTLSIKKNWICEMLKEKKDATSVGVKQN